MAETARKLKDKASQAYTEGRLKDALRLYGEVVAKDPAELGCRIKVGDIHRRLEDGNSAVVAYQPVAKAYAEDGFLLKAIAVCKVILSIDGDHTDTQQMLADLYAKRRGQTKPVAGPGPVPVTLRQLGVSIPAEREVRDVSAEYGVPAGLSAPAVSWPVSSGPAPGGHREIDIAMGTPLVEGEPETPPDVQVGERLEDSSLHITVAAELLEPVPHGPATTGDPETADTLEDRPAFSELPQIGMDATWSGEVRLADLEAPVLLEKRREEDSLEDLGRPHLPLFSDLPKNAFIELLVKMEMHEAEPGDVLIREGDVGDAIFIVASGRVRVERLSKNGRTVVLAHLTDGAFFGEMALLQDGARTASVIVEEPSQIFVISKEVLDHVTREFASVAAVLRNFYRQRLLSTTMATHPLFSPFAPEQRRSVMEMFKSKSFDKGDILLEQGKKGTGLFLLLYGALDVVREGDGSAPETVAELSSGDLCGEMSLLTGRPVMATIRAASPCFVLRLSKKKFDEIIMTHPQILELVSNLSHGRVESNDRAIEQGGRATGVVLV